MTIYCPHPGYSHCQVAEAKRMLLGRGDWSEWTECHLTWKNLSSVITIIIPAAVVDPA